MALALGMLLACSAANAQLGGITKPVSLGIRAGGYMPKDRPVGMSKTWFAAGVDARVNISALPIIGGQTVSLDYLTRGSSSVSAITLVQRFSSPVAAPVQGGVRPYFGVGVGVYRVHVKTDTGSDTKTGPGAKALVGLEIGQGLYVQGDYHLPAFGKVAGLRASGFAVTAGLRF
jgi:opacity protein-like surface antigen